MQKEIVSRPAPAKIVRPRREWRGDQRKGRPDGESRKTAGIARPRATRTFSVDADVPIPPAHSREGGNPGSQAALSRFLALGPRTVAREDGRPALVCGDERTTMRELNVIEKRALHPKDYFIAASNI